MRNISEAALVVFFGHDLRNLRKAKWDLEQHEFNYCSSGICTMTL